MELPSVGGSHPTLGEPAENGKQRKAGFSRFLTAPAETPLLSFLKLGLTPSVPPVLRPLDSHWMTPAASPGFYLANGTWCDLDSVILWANSSSWISFFFFFILLALFLWRILVKITTMMKWKLKDWFYCCIMYPPGIWFVRQIEITQRIIFLHKFHMWAGHGGSHL